MKVNREEIQSAECMMAVALRRAAGGEQEIPQFTK